MAGGKPIAWLLRARAGVTISTTNRAAFMLLKDLPSVVWTSLIGHAFLDTYDSFGDSSRSVRP